MKDGLLTFLAMGGYGFYVWSSYAIAAVAIAIEIVAVRARFRSAMNLGSRSDRGVTLPDDTK